MLQEVGTYTCCKLYWACNFITTAGLAEIYMIAQFCLLYDHFKQNRWKHQIISVISKHPDKVC